jgi:hypothetical protein
MGHLGVLLFRCALARNHEQHRGKQMKTTMALAIALGLGSLAACNNSPQ